MNYSPFYCVAVTSCSVEDLKAILNGHNFDDFWTEGPWTAAIVPLWNIDAGEVEGQLKKSQNRFLRLSHGEACWELALLNGGEKIFQFQHNFQYTNPYQFRSLRRECLYYDPRHPRVQDLPEGPPHLPNIYKFAYEYFGLAPEETDPLLELDDSVIIDEFLHHQVKKILTTLAEQGIPHTPQRVEDSLYARGVENWEMESEVGNAPAFLRGLGLEKIDEITSEGREEWQEDYDDGVSFDLYQVAAFHEPTNPEDLQDDLQKHGFSVVGTDGPWVWAGSSTDQVHLPQFRKALSQWKESGFWVVKERSSEWTLQIIEGGEIADSFIHDGSELRHQDPKHWQDKLVAARGNWDELAQNYFHMESAGAMKNSISIKEGIDALRQKRVDQVRAALDKRSLPYQSSRLTWVLNGREEWRQCGDLPALLVALGLDTLYPQWEQAHRDAYGPDMDTPQTEWALRVFDRVSHSPVPLEHGSVVQPLVNATRVFWLPFFMTDSAEPVILIDLPDGREWSPHWLWRREVQIGEVDGRIALGFPKTGAKWEDVQKMEKLGKLLVTLPEGSDLEITTVGSLKCAHQTYRGTILDGKWNIETTFPPLPPRALEEALELASRVENHDKLKAKDEGESRHILKACKRDLYLKDYKVYSDNLQFKARGGHGDSFFYPLMGMRLFRERFDGIWDMTEVKEEEEKNWEEELEWQAKTKALGDSVAKALAVPGRGKNVLETDVATYWELDRSAVDTGEDERDFHQNMEDLGFVYLGSLSCDKTPDVAIRAYHHSEQPISGAVLIGVMGTGIDLITTYSDESAVTTSLIEGAENHDETTWIKHSHPNLSPAELLKKHHKHTGVHQNSSEPQPAPSSLVDYAHLLDRYFRQSKMYE